MARSEEGVMSNETFTAATARAAAAKFLRSRSKDPMVRASDSLCAALAVLIEGDGYVAHGGGCPKEVDEYAPRCKCGLDKALKSARATLARARGEA
jgi:hypothetical protein